MTIGNLFISDMNRRTIDKKKHNILSTNLEAGLWSKAGDPPLPATEAGRVLLPLLPPYAVENQVGYNFSVCVWHPLMRLYFVKRFLAHSVLRIKQSRQREASVNTFRFNEFSRTYSRSVAELNVVLY